MKKDFKAFTLVEMLIVMGIIIILMAVGIASGRFAIRRANKIEHQNAAEQIYQAMQSYYSDKREYPGKGAIEPIGDIVSGENLDDLEDSIAEYIDDFDGGSEATYAYQVDASGQQVIICVTYGGAGDANNLGMYCTGNAIGSTDFDSTPMPSAKDLDYGTDDYDTAASLYPNYASVWVPNPVSPATEWSNATTDEQLPDADTSGG
jgi:type II secretory pathway pseudopilin PulG